MKINQIQATESKLYQKELKRNDKNSSEKELPKDQLDIKKTKSPTYKLSSSDVKATLKQIEKQLGTSNELSKIHHQFNKESVTHLLES